MRLSLRSVKLGSLLALTACLGALGSGCFFVGSDESGGDAGGGPNNVVPTQPEQVTIDADAKLTVDPGAGVGVFVEYATGGHWNVFTACDFNTPTNPGYACPFDIFATVLDQGASISNVKGEELDGRDAIELQSDGTVHFYAENTVSLSGFTFDTPPGATVEIEVYLDSEADPRLLYWVGKDIKHSGAPTDPLDFQPSEAAAPASGGDAGAGGAPPSGAP